MATVLSTLYPPLIDTFMPAFPNTGNADVQFTVSPYNSSYDIYYLHVTLVDQRTNKNAFATDSGVETPPGTALVNGVWIIPFNEILDGNTNNFIDFNRDMNHYTLHIPPSILKQNQVNQRAFVVNSYYKVQLRFDKYNNSDFSIATITSDYLSTKRAYFSEWSSVCLLKAIPEITVHFNNFTQELDDYRRKTNSSITNLPTNFVVPIRTPQYVPGIIPFAGNLTFEGFDDSGINQNTNTEYYKKDIKTTSNSEYLMSYQIVITNQSGEVIDESGKQFPSKAEKTNNFYWLSDLTDKSTSDTYTVTLTFTTNNQYTFSKSFDFMLAESIVNFKPTFDFHKKELIYNGKGYVRKSYKDENDVTQWYEDETEKVLVTSEEGTITLTIGIQDAAELGSGYLFIKRADSLDNFKTWTLLECEYVNEPDGYTKTIVDRTVSSLTRYKYSCQYLTAKGNWSNNIVHNSEVYPDFHDILLSRGDRQLAIRYNAQINSMTPVVNRVKIDTLGGRYPKFAENAKIHYRQFQLSGMIIAESDYNRAFLNDNDYKEEMDTYNRHMNGKTLVRNDTVVEDSGSHDSYPFENWWWERKFRDEAIEWLNDGEPKLFRSMTEGNIIVMVDAVSLTPNPQLGRRVWNFSATLYEVGDGNSLDQLDALGIYNIANDYDQNLMKFLEQSSDAIATPYINKQFLSQTYSITASDEENTATKIVNITNANDRHGKTLVLSDNENWSQKDRESWAEVPTIGETIQKMYSGVYQNYEFNSYSIKLTDVKIQFESLPQWYDLDALSPEGTDPYAVYITLKRTDSNTHATEEFSGYIYWDNQQQEVKWKPAIEHSQPIWSISGMSLTDFLNEWENSCGNIYKTIVEDLSDPNSDSHYISTKASQTPYLKGKIKIKDNEYILLDDVINNCYNSELHPIEEIEENDNIDTYYYGVDKDQDEQERNNVVYLEKDLLDTNLVYKEILDAMAKTANGEEFSLEDEYYTQSIKDKWDYYQGVDNLFYRVKNNFASEYYKLSDISEEEPVYIPKSNLSLYRKLGQPISINLEENTLTNNFETWNGLFTFTLNMTTTDLNGINIFDDFYNATAITQNKEKEITIPKEVISSSQPEVNQNNHIGTVHITFDADSSNGGYIDRSTETQTILGEAFDLYMSFQKNEIDDTKTDFIYSLEAPYIPINKNRNKVFAGWYVIDESGEEIRKFIWAKEKDENLFGFNIDTDFQNKDTVELKVKAKWEDIESTTYKQLTCIKINKTDASITFSLQPWESIIIDNLPKNISYHIVPTIVPDGYEIDDATDIITDSDKNNITIKYKTEDLHSGIFSIKGKVSLSNIGDTNVNVNEFAYILQKRDGNKYIDIAKVFNSYDGSFIFENIQEKLSDQNSSRSTGYRIVPVMDKENITYKTSSKSFVVEWKYENDKWNANNQNSFPEIAFENVRTGEKNQPYIDNEKDYILNTELLDRKDITYYEKDEIPIIIQDTNGAATWGSKVVFNIVENDIEDDTENDKYYIKYNNLYLQVADIKNAPWYVKADPTNHPDKYTAIKDIHTIFYKDGKNYIEISNNEETYIKILNKDNALIEMFSNPIYYYIKSSAWNSNQNEYYYYNNVFSYIDEMDNEITNNQWLPIEKVDINTLYENLNATDSIVKNFIESSDTIIDNNKEYYYKTSLKPVEPYPTKDYFKLIDFFIKVDENKEDSLYLKDLKHYVYVANVNAYYPQENIQHDSSTIGPGNELLKINLDSGEDLVYSGLGDDEGGTDKIVSAMKETLDEKTRKLVDKNYGLGYKLKVTLTSPYNPTMNLERTIFVNQRGYYQIPSNMIVKEISLFDGASATIDYILEYDLKYNDVAEPNSYEATENIVGQVSGNWDYTTQIQPLIYNKYWAYDKESNGNITQQSVDYWRAVSFEGTSYAILGIKSTMDTETQKYIVGRTGVLALETEYLVDAMYINGRRMVQVPEYRHKYLDEWEYTIDPSVYGQTPEDSEVGGQYWWIVYNYNSDTKDGNEITDWDESEIAVLIYLNAPYTDPENARQAVQTWYNLDDPINEYHSKAEILHPEINRIYGIINPEGGIEYRIFYIDGGWYTVDFPNKKENGSIDYSICNAHVPINGMVNYRATIMKKCWDGV